MGTTYRDFSLWIERSPQGSGYRVKARCPAGEESAPFALPKIGEEALQIFADLAQRKAQARNLAAVNGSAGNQAKPWKAWEIGDILFRALISGPVRQLYDRSCGGLAERKCGLRIKLHFEPETAELCNLPWELLYSSETKDYLGLDRLTPLVRYLELARPNESLPFEPPLRVLVAAANPPGSDQLDLNKENGSIRQLLGTGAEISELKNTQLDSLRDKLLRTPYHVLHFMGHGLFDDASGTGSLLLEGEDGGPEIISGEVLANHLKGCLPRLVVVNACDSGRAPSDHGQDFFAGIASSLVMAGVLAVVAMRTPISDRAAVVFSKTLYKELAAGAPVDAAVAEGRLAIYRIDSLSLEWATPVLFMRTPDGDLFAVPQESETGSGFSNPPERDELWLGPASETRGKNVDLCNVQGKDEGRAASTRLEGRIVAEENVVIVNRRTSD